LNFRAHKGFIMKYACIALALGVVGFATTAVGQEVIVPAPAYVAPAPVVTYYSPAPVTAYYAPAPVVSYYAPYTVAYAPAYGYYPAPYYAPRWAYRRAARWGW
jgi:hypothetical protein